MKFETLIFLETFVVYFCQTTFSCLRSGAVCFVSMELSFTWCISYLRECLYLNSNFFSPNKARFQFNSKKILHTKDKTSDVIKAAEVQFSTIFASQMELKFLLNTDYTLVRIVLYNIIRCAFEFWLG